MLSILVYLLCLISPFHYCMLNPCSSLTLSRTRGRVYCVKAWSDDKTLGEKQLDCFVIQCTCLPVTLPFHHSTWLCLHRGQNSVSWVQYSQQDCNAYASLLLHQRALLKWRVCVGAGSNVTWLGLAIGDSRHAESSARRCARGSWQRVRPVCQVQQAGKSGETIWHKCNTKEECCSAV